jgi:hypothetical protein
MKRVLAAAFLLGSFCFAQSTAPAPTGSTGPALAANTEVTEQLVPVSRSDIYCSGMVTKTPVSRANYVAGGLGTPDAVRFGERDLIYLKGSGYQPGALVSVIREWRNPDGSEHYKGVRKLQAEAGQPYLDQAYARIVEQRGEFSIARVEFSCDAVMAGDLVVPFVERPQVNVRQHTTVNRFPVQSGAPNGKIVMVREGDQYASVGRKVFLNIGSDKSVKPGDYFRVSRGYSKDVYDQADQATLSSTIVDDTQKNPPHMDKKNELPPRLIGELVVLNVLPNSSTAMVTFIMEEMHAGDIVEQEPAQ